MGYPQNKRICCLFPGTVGVVKRESDTSSWLRTTEELRLVGFCSQFPSSIPGISLSILSTDVSEWEFHRSKVLSKGPSSPFGVLESESPFLSHRLIPTPTQVIDTWTVRERFVVSTVFVESKGFRLKRVVC